MTGLNLSEWISEFCVLHARVKEGNVSPDEAAEYTTARGELAGALLLAQRLNLNSGENPRRALRVARALQIELEFPSGVVTALTQDLSVGGVSALVPEAPPVGTRILYKMKMSRTTDPIVGAAKVVNVGEWRGAMRIALMFEALSSADRERIEMLVIDAVVSHFGGVRANP